MKPLQLVELYEYAPITHAFDEVEVKVPEGLYERLCATRAAYLAVCNEIDQYQTRVVTN